METKIIFLIGALAALAFAFIFIVISVRRVKKYDLPLIESKLAYLQDIPEISWTVFVKNRVYIGFHTKIADMVSICRYAAVKGSRACGCSVYVYAVSSAGGNYKTAERYGYAVARRGRITKSRQWVCID